MIQQRIYEKKSIIQDKQRIIILLFPEVFEHRLRVPS